VPGLGDDKLLQCGGAGCLDGYAVRIQERLRRWLPGPDNGINGYLLAVGASVWLTVTVVVLTGCQTPLHLTILLNYGQTGLAATTMLEAFSDLGGGAVATTSYRLKGVIRR